MRAVPDLVNCNLHEASRSACHTKMSDVYVFVQRFSWTSPVVSRARVIYRA